MADLLKTLAYIDLVELSNFLAEHYDWPALGTADSFHRTLAEALDYPSNGELVWIEMPDEDDHFEATAEAYSSQYATVVSVLRRLTRDGHLPSLPEYNIKVWW